MLILFVETNTLLWNQQQRRSDADDAQHDSEMVACMRRDSQVEDYLHKPPINQCSLSFLKPRFESDYRHKYLSEGSGDGDALLSLPRWSSCRDAVMSLIFFALVAVCCFLNFRLQASLIVVVILATLLQVCIVVPHILTVYCAKVAPPFIVGIGTSLMSFYARHAVGALIASIPIATVLAAFSCATFDSRIFSDLFFALALSVSLLHYCNFTVLSSWLKSTLATLAGLCVLILVALAVCAESDAKPEIVDNVTATTASPLNSTILDLNLTLSDDVMGGIGAGIFAGEKSLTMEAIVNIVTLLLLVWFLNRDIEKSCRLSYHGDVQAMCDRKQMQDEKEQADWLLHNIIPEHVINELKATKRYCKNHTDVGVVFAKVTNYDDFYDESYQGGKEYLRVRNELMGDFEELFDDPKYKDVEKIKTIGSCLMIASGLNPETRNSNTHPHAHLFALMDFCQQLLHRLQDFNAEIFNFSFEMAIGFNCGPVTAGVIGTTKLLYDIWGDTVNVSSRMYSTGVSGRIQVTGDCAKYLEPMFDFDYRGQIFVKGKGDLPSYLLKGKKAGATWS